MGPVTSCKFQGNTASIMKIGYIFDSFFSNLKQMNQELKLKRKRRMSLSNVITLGTFYIKFLLLICRRLTVVHFEI